MTESPAPPTSPPDAVIITFLNYVAAQANGYVGNARQAADAAAAIDVPEALIEALFTSARTRSLLEPDFNARGRTRWIVSRKGLAFLERHQPAS